MLSAGASSSSPSSSLSENRNQKSNSPLQNSYQQQPNSNSTKRVMTDSSVLLHSETLIKPDLESCGQTMPDVNAGVNRYQPAANTSTTFFDESEHQFMESFLNGFLDENEIITPTAIDSDHNDEYSAAPSQKSKDMFVPPPPPPKTAVGELYLPQPRPHQTFASQSSGNMAMPLNMKFYPIHVPSITSSMSYNTLSGIPQSASASSSFENMHTLSQYEIHYQARATFDNNNHPEPRAAPSRSYTRPVKEPYASVDVNHPPMAPGCVPAPVLAPRKKRHSSRSQLTDSEKKANHIASEQKRRRNIRLGFCALTQIIPDLRGFTERYLSDDEVEAEVAGAGPSRKKGRSDKATGAAPSKAAILERTIEYIQFMKNRTDRLSQRSQELSDRLKNREQR